MNPSYRHENKYLIDAVQRQILHMKAAELMEMDAHTGPRQYYTIRSLYFDSSDNACFWDTVDGYDSRTKYRIRFYNGDAGTLKLERKFKVSNMTRKESIAISRSICDQLIMRDYAGINTGVDKTLLSVLTEMRLERVQPTVIVEYDRIPFVYNAGDARITFDVNISSSCDVMNFLEEGIPMRPIMTPGLGVLEVKYTGLFPKHIHDCLNIDRLQRTGFSKYVLCRYYSMSGA